jgi:two-component system NtrC family sensor kinase
MAGLALVLASMLVFLYVRTRGYDASTYFENVALLRQLKELDARWELDVLKVKIGTNTDYDSLVDTLFNLNRLRQALQAAVTSQPHAAAGALADGSEAFHRAIQEKARLIEHFKSHNAVLRNSLAFLPTAANDVQRAMSRDGGSGQTAPNKVLAGVDEALLNSMVYSQAPSNDEATGIQADLDRLAAGRANLSAAVAESLDIFTSHVRAILREQPVVNGLLKGIAAVPAAARIEDLDNLLSSEQQQSQLQAQQYRQYLLIFAAALAGLLLYAAVGLIRSYAVINRVNKELQRTNVTLERRVRERTHDLTDAKETAERANRAKSGFLATMSHELRTPLNSIIGFSELVLAESMGPLGNEQYRGYIKNVLESGQHLLELINDILDLAKAEAGKLILQEDKVDPLSAVESACRIMNHRLQEFGLTLVNRLPKNLPWLRADELRLKEVLLNLLSNAVKFTPASGRIEISVVVDHSGLAIIVADTGVGIAPEDFDKVFEPFGQVDGTLSRRHAGTGLGLPLVKSIMELHGGSLRLESEVGVGTRVTAQFPRERVITEAIPEPREFNDAA